MILLFGPLEISRNDETQLARVWFNDKDKKDCIHHSCDMFHFLSEIESTIEIEVCNT